MLQLVMGRSGFGKTDYVRERAVTLAQNGYGGVILLVPEQLSFQTERAILQAAGPHVAASIKVLTFSRLTEEVFRTYGGITEQRVDDSGKALFMALAISDCEDQLSLYAQAAKSDRLTALMLETVEELKCSGIEPQALFDICDSLRGAVREKVREIALIYAAFESLLKGSYIEPDDLLTRAGALLRVNPFFKGKTLFIDGFEGFNRQKLQVLASALRDCDVVTCTLTCPAFSGIDTASLFAPMEETGRRLTALAREAGVKVLVPVVLEKPLRFENTAMAQVEALHGGFADCGAAEGNLIVYKAPDLYKELEYVAATIRSLVMEGCRYGDIAVICRNGKKYGALLESTFRRFEIPAFVARPRAVDAAPLARLVLTAFGVAEYGFRTEDILLFLKTGLCGLDTGAVSDLENYAYLWRITGSGWKHSFEKSPEGFGQNSGEAQLAVLEEYRRQFVFPLLHFVERTADASGAEISEAVFMLLEELRCENAVLLTEQKLREAGALEEAQEQLRFWKELMDILDRFALILGARRVSRKRYGSLLREILSQERIMDIPLRLDTVLFGTAEQIKHAAKIVFLVGAVQGEFPLVPPERGIFTPDERRTLQEHSCPLEFREEEALLLERYYAYTAASSASRRLYISYPASDGKNDCTPSELATKTAGAFGIAVLEDLPREYFANCPESAFSAAAGAFRENSAEAAALQRVVGELPAYAGRLDAIARASSTEPYRIRDRALSAAMFENKIYSPSQIDTYHRCKFQYFCRYGLGAMERKPAQVDVLEYGSLLHYVFEHFLQDEDYRQMDEQKIRLRAELLIGRYAAENMGGREALPPRDRYRLRRMEDTAVLLMQRLAEELRESDFTPAHLELKLEEGSVFPPLKIPLAGGKQAVVGGIIDRVDLYEEEGKRWVRVVDYKTGRKEFKLVDVLSGLSLQMLVYLNALKEKGLLPAGALYMPSAYPNISMEKTGDREKEQKNLTQERDKKLCMSGVVINDETVIRAMEHGAQGRFIPVGIDDKGKYKRPDNAMEEQELDLLFRYVRGLIAKMAGELAAGNVAAEPLMTNTDSCGWCAYSAVCGMRQEETTALSMKKDEVLREMEERGDLHAEMD